MSECPHCGGEDFICAQCGRQTDEITEARLAARELLDRVLLTVHLDQESAAGIRAHWEKKHPWLKVENWP